MSEPPQSTDAQDLDDLRARGQLTAAERMAGILGLRDRAAWVTWLHRLLLFVGAGLALAGVVCFFAYNWSQMGRFTRFGIVGAAISACLAGTARAGLDELSGKVGLTGASTLVGIFLAVTGQVYQTGADPWTLFAAWALLILPWVCMARFAGLWVLWLLIAELGLGLWGFQVAVPRALLSGSTALALCGGTAALALGVREVWARRGATWLEARWSRWAALGLALLPLTFEGCRGGSWFFGFSWRMFAGA